MNFGTYDRFAAEMRSTTMQRSIVAGSAVLPHPDARSRQDGKGNWQKINRHGNCAMISPWMGESLPCRLSVVKLDKRAEESTGSSLPMWGASGAWIIVWMELDLYGCYVDRVGRSWSPLLTIGVD